MTYRLMPRQIEERYHECISSGKNKDECVQEIQPFIDQYEDKKGVKYMIQLQRTQRKKYEASRKKGIGVLADVKQSLRRG